jgi:hypothetical protein
MWHPMARLAGVTQLTKCRILTLACLAVVINIAYEDTDILMQLSVLTVRVVASYNNPLKSKHSVGFEVLTAVSTKMAVFWVLAPCSLVEVYQRFRGPCCFHHQGDPPLSPYNPEDSHLRLKIPYSKENNTSPCQRSIGYFCLGKESLFTLRMIRNPQIHCVGKVQSYWLL